MTDRKQGEIMCDTLYKKIPNGYLFAKNSDRSPNEPNLTLFIPAKVHKDKELKCTYITIPQINKTYGCVIVRPSWTFGAEMGINDQGVSIGNEAVFTRSKAKKDPSLIGMDYVRLGLERAKSAKEAIEVITKLLETYGQGGNCGFDKPFYYDNSYLIADYKEGWILETSGKNWVAKPIDDIGNISNRLSIHKEATLKKCDIETNFFKDNTEPIYTYFSGSKARSAQGHCGLKALTDNDLIKLRSLMRSHHPKDLDHLFKKGSIRSLCMHYSMLGDHTTSSMVLEATTAGTIMFLTSASAPCFRLFKPAFFDEHEHIVFNDEQAAFQYWLSHEKITRALYAGLIDESEYRSRLKHSQRQIDTLTEDYLRSPANENKGKLVKDCLEIEKEFIEPYRNLVINDINDHSPKLWKRKNGFLGKNVFQNDLPSRMVK